MTSVTSSPEATGISRLSSVSEPTAGYQVARFAYRSSGDERNSRRGILGTRRRSILHPGEFPEKELLAPDRIQTCRGFKVEAATYLADTNN